MLHGLYSFFFICTVSVLFRVCFGLEKTVSFSCNEEPSDTNLVNISIRIIPNQDPVHKVYGIEATSGDSSISANRIDACVREPPSVDTDAILFDLSFDITGSSFECGATVTDLSGVSGVKKVTVILRVFAYSEILLSGDDDVYVFECRSDNLNTGIIRAGALDQSTVVVPSVTVLPTRYGSFLRIRDAATDVPVTVGFLNQPVYISVEFFPQLKQGPDTFGTLFYIGFLGNDVISGASASSLFIVVVPKYNKGRTDVMVTTSAGAQQQNVSNGSAMVFDLASDLQGCSDGGVAEIDYKGVKVNSYDAEVAVMVYNREADTEDMYTASPLDVLGTRYNTVSMPTLNDASELMIIGTDNDTTVSITIPATTTLSVTLNGTTKSAGEVMSFTLNERQTFHLAVSSSSSVESLTGYLVTSDKPVAVISGNRKFSDDHLVDQLSPTTQLGDHYILTPADPTSDNRLTTYIIQAVESGDTIVTRYLTSSTHENYTITLTTNPVKTITVAHNEPCEIFSDKPVQVTLVVNPPAGGSTDFESAMLNIPPVFQWAHEYTFYQKDYFSKIAFILPSNVTIVTIDGNDTPLATKIPVIGPNDYQFSDQDIGLPGDMMFKLSTSTANNKLYKLLPIVYPQKTGTLNSGSVLIPPGLLKAVKDYCFPVGYNGDGVDNDCDGKIDEELKDGLDNDGDGYFDEDTLLQADFGGARAQRPFSCAVSGVEDFSVPTKLIPLTKADGCKENRTGPFGLLGEFENVDTDTIGSDTQPKQLKSGNFTLGKFVDSPKLYFRCDSTLCYSATDDNCRVICSPVTRKKRQEETVPNNITSDVWIYPYIPEDNDAASSSDDCTRAIVTTQTCLENTNIQIIMGVLMTLFVLAFTTAFCFCCQFRRRWKKEKQTSSRSSTYNGSIADSHSKRNVSTRYRY